MTADERREFLINLDKCFIKYQSELIRYNRKYLKHKGIGPKVEKAFTRLLNSVEDLEIQAYDAKCMLDEEREF